MRRSRTGSERGLLAAGMLLATLALAGCESAEDQEIRTLIEEIAALQEQRIAVMETTAEEEIADDRKHDPGKVEQTEQQWEERLQAARNSHERTLTKLRETLASRDWETAYPEETALLNASPLVIVRGVLSSRQRHLQHAEEVRAGQAAWRERRARNRAQAERNSEAMRRLPDPSAWR